MCVTPSEKCLCLRSFEYKNRAYYGKAACVRIRDIARFVFVIKNPQANAIKEAEENLVFV